MKRALLLTMMLAACGPEAPPKHAGPCSEAERADSRNEARESDEGACHICHQELARRGIGETEQKYACDCLADDCGYWSPTEGAVEWTSVGQLQYQEDMDAACRDIPDYTEAICG